MKPVRLEHTPNQHWSIHVHCETRQDGHKIVPMLRKHLGSASIVGQKANHITVCYHKKPGVPSEHQTHHHFAEHVLKPLGIPHEEIK